MFKKLLLAVMALGMASCSTGKMNAEYKNLRVNTQMSHSIFLEPVDPEQQIIYVKVKSSTGNKDFRLQNAISSEMRSLGYKVTNKPSEANFMLQANIRNYTSKSEAADGTGESIVGAVVGGVLGSAIGGGKGQDIATTLGAVAGGAAAQHMANNVVLVEYEALVDIVISERSQEKVDYNNFQENSGGIGNTVTANFTNKSNWKKYRTKLVTRAAKINLTEAEATPVIVNDIVTSLSSLF